MQYLKPIYSFLNEEALPLNMAKEFTAMGQQRPEDVKRRLNEIMGGQQRVYVPVGSYKLENDSYLKIKKFLTSIGYSIKDYKLGIAFQTDNPKREIRIGKLLNKEGQKNLLKLFTEDPDREMVKQQTKYSIVICQHPYDIAGMSYGTGRESWQDKTCLNVIKGCNRHFVPDEIKKGTLTVYLIKSEDKNIKEPLGRINVKPYFEVSIEEYEDDVDTWVWCPDINTYGLFSDDAKKTLIDWILSWQPEEMFKEGELYSKVKGLYSDAGSPEFLKYEDSFAEMITHEGFNVAELWDANGQYFYFFMEILSDVCDLEPEDITIVDVGYDDDGDGGYAIHYYNIKINTDFKFDFYKYSQTYNNRGSYDYFLNTLNIVEVDGDLTIAGEDDEDCMYIFDNNCIINGDLNIYIIDYGNSEKTFKVTTKLNKERTTVLISELNGQSYDSYVSYIFRNLPDGKHINFESGRMYTDFLDSAEADEFLYYLHRYCNGKSVDLYEDYSSDFEEYCSDEGYDEDSEEYQNISEFMDKVDFLIDTLWDGNNGGLLHTYDTGRFQFYNPDKIKDYIYKGKILFPIKNIYSNVVDLSNCGLTTLENLPNYIGGGSSVEDIKKSILDLSGNELTSLEGLPTGVGTIILKDNKIEDIDGINNPSSNLIKLDLSGNYLESVDGIMKWYRNLRELIVDNQKSGKVIDYKIEENSQLTAEEKDFIDRHNIMFDLFDEGYLVKGDLHIKNEDIKIKLFTVQGNFTVEQVDLTKDINIKNFPMGVNGNLNIKLCNLNSFLTPSELGTGGNRYIRLGGDLILDALPQLKSLKNLWVNTGSKGRSKLQIVNCESLEDIDLFGGNGDSTYFKYVVIERCEELKDLINLQNILEEEGSVRLSNLVIDKNVTFNNDTKGGYLNNLVINKSQVKSFKGFPKVVYDNINFNECNLMNVTSFDGFPYDISTNTTISFRACKIPEVLGGGDVEVFKQKCLEYIESKMGVGNAPEMLIVEIKN
jgi:hypothetical protein